MDIKPPFRLPIAPTAQLGQARQQEFNMSMLKLTPFNFIPAHPVISLFKPMCLFLSFQPQGVGSFLESLLCALVCLYSVLWTPARQPVFDYVLTSLFLAIEAEQAKDGLYGNVGVRLDCARHAPFISWHSPCTYFPAHLTLKPRFHLSSFGGGGAFSLLLLGWGRASANALMKLAILCRAIMPYGVTLKFCPAILTKSWTITPPPVHPFPPH